MSEEMLKTLSQPGVVIVALLWINNRLNRVEAQMALLANHAGAPVLAKKNWRGKLPLLSVIVAVALAGCASIHQTNRTTTTGTNGVVTEMVLDTRCMTVGDANQAIERLRGSNGKTLSFGMEGEQQNASTTNAVEALRELNKLVSSLPK